nr:p49 [Cnaphalocrocis medinalis granulovirus]
MDINDEDLLPLVFIHMYFDLNKKDMIEDVVNYIGNNENTQTILDYLTEMKLKHMVGDATPDTFNYIMPQFKYVCSGDYQLEIIKVDYGNVYLQKGAVVYATNLFVPNITNAMNYILQSLPDLVKHNEGIASVGEKFYIVNGNEGVLFARPYLDWMGMKICNGTPKSDDNLYYRLYLVGENLTKSVIDKKLEYTPIKGSVLKNYHKGTPLSRFDNERYVLNEKRFTTNNCDIVFDAFEEEFDTKRARVHFVQRDYIYDATNYPSQLLQELQKNWVSHTALYKIINRFNTQNSLPDLNDALVIDRYGINNYRKMIVVNNQYVVMPYTNNAPSSDVEYLFVTKDILQFRHTLNAAYVPVLGVVILAKHVFFGARQVLDFEPHQDLTTFVKRKIQINDGDIYYHVAGTYFLEETFFTVNSVPIYILVRVEDNLIIRHNLITNSRKLQNLKHSWVFNTITSLFVRKY